MRVFPILFLLGAYHGLNPAMGWLFAVSRGLQGKTGKAVVNSLMPLSLGHLASIAAVIGAVQVARFTLPLGAVRVIAAIILIGFGLYRLLRRRHPRWVGMQVGARDLTLWSFLMASAHGAGLMLFPVLLNLPICTSAAATTAARGLGPGVFAMAQTALWVVALHTAAMLIVMGTVAITVYDWLGLGILRTAWINVDRLWAATLLGSGLIVLVV
jgi:hypothetical protein